ncbi:hypothetical protein [[Mycoplasma] anseris]|nr:hypothetical protein [[Mycoplasma] anseris]
MEIQKIKCKLILHGSFLLKQKGIIEREPIDIDLGFIENMSYQEKNNCWMKFISNFIVLDKIINNQLQKKYIITFESKTYIIECLFGKNIANDQIATYNGINVLKDEFFIISKFAQLCSRLYAYNKYNKEELLTKIHIIVEDITRIRNYVNIHQDNDFFFWNFQRNIMSNFEFDLLANKENLYNTFFFIDENLNRLNIFNNFTIKEYVELSKTNLNFISFIKNMNTVYWSRDFIVDKIIDEQIIVGRLLTNLYIKNTKDNLVKIKQKLIRKKTDCENIMVNIFH